MTPQPHDFKAALEALDGRAFIDVVHTHECGSRHKSFCFCEAGDINQTDLSKAIRFALRLAERVCGEPSDMSMSMVIAGGDDAACNKRG